MRFQHLVLLIVAAAAPSIQAAGLDGSAGVEPPALRPLIARANAYLSVGQFGDAARTYTEAIEQAPNDYLLYYKRATAYFSLNRHANAMDDFETVLRLTNGSFDKALLMQAKVHAREAKWAEAKKLIKTYTKKAGNSDKDVQDLLFGISEGEVATKKAQQAAKAKKYEECIEHATSALTTASHAIWLRELRTDCSLASGDVEQAVGDMIRLTHLTKPSNTLFQRIATLSYYLTPPPNPQAQQTLKQCLHYDPDSKPCRVALRTLKSLEKDFTKLETYESSEKWREIFTLIAPTGGDFAARFDKALDDAVSALEPSLPESVRPKKMSARRLKIYSLACKAYVKSGQIKKAEEWCETTLTMDEKSLDGLIGRGEAKMKKEEWEDAVRAFEAAFEASGRSSQEIGEKLQRAQRLLKQSRKKDYYKVLGVSRDADQQTVKRAYRKAVIKAHPDKGGSESKMAIVNEAYEVLSNPELRARFDNGDDPNDPEAGQGGPGGGHPFHFGGGRNPFQHVVFQQGGGGFGGGGGRGSPFGDGGFQFQWGG